MYEPIDLWTGIRRAEAPVTTGWIACTRHGAGALVELAHEWAELDRDAASCPASLGLVRQAATDLPADAIRIVTIRHGGRLVAVWPLRHTTLGPLRVVGRLCRGLQVYDAPTIRRGVDPVAATRAAWAEVQRWADVDVVQLPLLEHDSPLMGVLDVARAAEPVEGTCTIDLAGITSADDFLARQTKRRRGSIRRRRRKLAAQGALAFDLVTDPVERRETIAWALAAKTDWLDTQEAASPTFRARWFHSGLLGAAVDPLARERFRVFRLRSAGRTIAVEIGHEDGDTWRSFVAAYDPDLYKLGPGVALQLEVIGWCGARGLKTYDLLPPITDFKQTWATAEAPAHAASVPVTRRGELLLPIVRDGRAALKRAYERLPPRLRTAAFRLAKLRER